MTQVLLSLGSNLAWDEAVRMLEGVCVPLSRLCPGMRFSSVYATRAEGHSTGTYANCMAVGDCPDDLATLEGACKRLEAELGRTDEARRRGLVPIDIDVVRYGSEIVRPANYTYTYMRRGLEELGLAT